MSEVTPTLGTLFESPSGDDPHRLPDGWKPLRDQLAQEVKGIKWSASMPDLAVKMAELLDVKIPGILVTAWKKTSALKTKLAESRAAPNDAFYLELADHTVASTHRPYITVQVGKGPSKKLEFTVTASFVLQGFVLKLQKGAIQEIRTGKCDAEGKLEGLGIRLAKKKSLSFPGTVAMADCSSAG